MFFPHNRLIRIIHSFNRYLLSVSARKREAGGRACEKQSEPEKQMFGKRRGLIMWDRPQIWWNPTPDQPKPSW
jgi:hypothetical protein